MNRPIACLVIAVLVAACGSNGSSEAESDSTVDTTPAADAYAAQVASYDLAADAPQRFLVGILGTDGGLIVGGSVDFEFAYIGDSPDAAPAAGPGVPTIDDARGEFITVAFGIEPADGPRFREGAEGVGVYEASGVDFGTAGFWEVTVSGTIGGEDFAIPTSFEVAPTALVPTVGDAAPRTVNPLPGGRGDPPKAVDSRAQDDGAVPDPDLHRLTIADAIATGKPTVVVISTPVFCVSRFCGPITDAVSAIAGEFEGRANFVHIEVWRDFENKVLNKSAADWIYRSPEAEATEPWVFLVGGDGNIVRRWDNVANGASVREALNAVVS